MIAVVRLRLAPWGRALTPGPRLRRRALVLLSIAAVLGAGYMLWLRNSSLVAVKQVTITGLTGSDAVQARAALERAAQRTTTLNPDRAAIEQTAAAYPSIRGLRITPDFPNSMAIRVLEHRPVAVLVLGNRRVAVAGDGSMLTDLPREGSLPTIEVQGSLPAARLEGGPALSAARVAGGAPAPITARLAGVSRARGRGLVARLKDGPLLIFGDSSRIAAKWAAAARVLADRDAAGADYIDLRIPERPAAGGLPVETVAPVAPAGAEQPAQVPPAQTAPPGPTAPQQTLDPQSSVQQP